MIKDIVPELLEKIQQEFQDNTAKSNILKAKIQALKTGKVTHLDSNEFAIEVGKILADIFKNEISADDLPDSRMYYNIAKRLIDLNLKINYDLVSDYSTNVQELLNKKSNISLKAIKTKLNQDRIDGIVNKISEYDDFEKGKWLLDEPIKNFTQSIVDDTIKTNADFQYKSGLTPKIIRKEVGNCCPWCKAVVGVYEYPDVPKDIYRRHQRCRCTVDYIPGNGKKQDIWSKKWTDSNESDKIQKRIDISNRIAAKNDVKHRLRKDLGFDTVDKSIDNLDQKLLSVNIDNLNKIENNFGAIHKSTISISSNKSKRRAMAYVSNYVKEPLKQDFVLNTNYFSDGKKLIDAAKSAIQKNWIMPAKVENYQVYVVTHEYGHILQNVIVADELESLGGFSAFETTAVTPEGRMKAYSDLKKKIKKRHLEEIMEIAVRNSEDPHNVIRNNLSTYGKTNPAEFFAEAFANSQLGEPNELGNAMLEWLKGKGY